LSIGQIFEIKMDYYLNITNKKKANYFTAILQQMKAFSAEISILFQEKGLYIQGMDSSHVCLYEVKLSKMWFDEYTFEDAVVGLNTQQLYNVLQTRKEDHEFRLDYTEQNDKIKFTFIPSSNHKKQSFQSKKQFNIATMDIDIEHLGIPNIDYDVIIEMPPTKWKSIVDEMALFSDSLRFDINNTGCTMKTTNTNCDASVQIEKEQFNQYTVIQDIRVCYNIRYLAMIAQSASIFPMMQLCITNEHPLVCKIDLYDFIQNGDKKCNDEEVDVEDEETNYYKIYLAPKIDDDDDNDDL